LEETGDAPEIAMRAGAEIFRLVVIVFGGSGGRALGVIQHPQDAARGAEGGVVPRGEPRYGVDLQGYGEGAQDARAEGAAGGVEGEEGGEVLREEGGEGLLGEGGEGFGHVEGSG
jgi:hypothetical protein